MYPAEEHYYTETNKIVLKLLGLWPYKKSRFILLQQVLTAFVVAFYVCMQFLNFVAKNFNMALFAKTVSLASPGFMTLLKYCFFILKSKTIKDLHYHMQEDWRIMQNKTENEILQKYAHKVQTFTTMIFYGIVTAFVTSGILQFLPIILDIIAPLDKPRPRKLLIPIEYFIFQDEYFYIKVFHEGLSTITCALILFATGTQLLIFIYHSLGIFEIASYRIEYSIENIMLQISDPIKMEYEIRKGVMLAVTTHRKAMNFADVMISSFNVPYCILAVSAVISLSITLYRFVEAVTITKDTQDIIISFFVTMGFLIYMYMANYMGQKVNDYNTEIFYSTYGISWYLMPVSSQKLILLLLQKAKKDFYFTIGYIFVARVESFAILINSALSYFAMMYSIQ